MEGEQRKISTGESSHVSSDEPSQENLKAMSVDQLKSRLQELLEYEDYLKAIAIRDELKSRNAD